MKNHNTSMGGELPSKFERGGQTYHFYSSLAADSKLVPKNEVAARNLMYVTTRLPYYVGIIPVSPGQEWRAFFRNQAVPRPALDSFFAKLVAQHPDFYDEGASLPVLGTNPEQVKVDGVMIPYPVAHPELIDISMSSVHVAQALDSVGITDPKLRTSQVQ